MEAEIKLTDTEVVFKHFILVWNKFVYFSSFFVISF